MTHEAHGSQRGHASFSRRDWLAKVSGGSAVLAGLALLGTAGCKDASARSADVVLYATADCGCCHKWAEHMTTAGYKVTTEFLQDVSVKKDALSVPMDLRSCHTAVIEGRVFEGHVPANHIRKFLGEGSEYRGLAVPGMPGGSPGMEDTPKVSYQVLAFRADGSTRVYAEV